MWKSLDFKFCAGQKSFVFSIHVIKEKNVSKETRLNLVVLEETVCDVQLVSWYLKKMVEVSEVAQLSISSIICKIDTHSHCNCGIFMNQICIEIIQPEVVFIDLNYKHSMINYRRTVLDIIIIICLYILYTYLPFSHVASHVT